MKELRKRISFLRHVKRFAKNASNSSFIITRYHVIQFPYVIIIIIVFLPVVFIIYFNNKPFAHVLRWSFSPASVHIIFYASVCI